MEKLLGRSKSDRRHVAAMKGLLKGGSKGVFKVVPVVLSLALAFACLAGCGSNVQGQGLQGLESQQRLSLKIAGKSYTESQLTAEVMALLLEAEGFRVDRKYDMAGAVCFEALKNGDVDLYPEYTGTMAWAYLDREIEPGTSPEVTYRMAKEGFAEAYDLILLESMGFNNTYANAVRTDFAEANGIRTNSDLVPFAKDLVYGAEHSFYDRNDGYFNMCDMYGYEFARYTKMDVGLKQQSINQGEIDVTAVYSTDGWLEGSGLTVLEDDMSFFPAYYCCPVVRKDALEKYPQIETILSVLKDCCSEEDIIYYNNLVDSKKMSIENAALQFIKDKDLLKTNT